MRFSSVLLTTLLTGAAVAQVAIPPHSAVYNGFSRGFNFTAATSFFITQLELPLNAQQAGDTSGFLVRINGATALRSVGNATPAIATNIQVVIGDVVDIIGNWSPAAPGNFTAHNSYTASMTNFATTIEGVAHTIQRTGWQWDIADPLWASGAYLAPVAGQMGRVLMYTSSGTGTVLATNTNIGAGCVQTFGSFYEYYGTAAAASAALQGNVLLLSPNGVGYQGVWLPGAAAATYLAPIAPTTLPTGDDGEVTLTPSIPLSTPYGPRPQLQVSGNGIIGFGNLFLDFPGSNTYTPTAGAFLNAIQGGIYAWHDFNSGETGSGPVQSEEIAGTLYITYNDVENYANPETTNRSTVQIQLDLATGLVRIVWLVVDANSTSVYGSAHLVGVTAPGASFDPGSVSLATASAAQLSTGLDQAGLAIGGTTRPITNTTWSLTTSNIPASGVIGLEILGLSDPGLNDLSFLGMPGCGLRANLDYLNAFLVGGATHAWGLAIPNSPSLLNVHVYASSAVAQAPPVNAFGWITSNAVDGKIGDF